MDSDADYNASSGSDVDDPDSVEVPGGGTSLKALQAANGSDVVQTSTGEGEVPLPSTSSSSVIPQPQSKSSQPNDTKVTPSVFTPSIVPIVPPNTYTSMEIPGESMHYARSLGLFKFLENDQEPITPLDFFAWSLPAGFALSMIKAYNKGQISDELLARAKQRCENQDTFNLLKSIITAQNRPGVDNVSLSGMFAASKLLDYNYDHLHLIPTTQLTSVEIFKYFDIISEDFRKSREEAAYEYQLSLQRLSAGLFEQTPGMPIKPDAADQSAASSKRYRPSVASLWGSAKEIEMIEAEALVEEDEEPDDEELIAAETYADYKPAKLQYGTKHPDTIVETASLASVLPPSCYYKLSLPDAVITDGLLSALQLESIVYACQQHEHFLPSGDRAGFLIGDGAGVGKGRTIAGIIFENYNCGRKKSIWVTASNDLVYDSERDLQDIGATKIKVNQLRSQKYGKIDNIKDGVLFVTYSGLIGEATTNVKVNTRLKQVTQWCGSNFDGVVVFDECHRAKNLCPTVGKSTKTGEAVRDLQAYLPKARVVYASATGASEPRHMAYMTRLGLWGKSTPFQDALHFIKGVEQRGVGAMELVAMDMKLRGAYIARQLSFHGVKFSIVDVPLPDGFEVMYNESVEFWIKLMNKFFEAIVLMKSGAKEKRSIWTFFWGAHQRFFKYLCIASKVKYTVEASRNAVKDGKCVVIGLQATGEAATLDQLERDEGELNEFVSTAKGVLYQLVEKFFPSPDNRKINLKTAKVNETSSMFQSLLDEMKQEPSSSSATKRKPVRKAAQKQNFKKSKGSSDESNQEDDSDFKLSDRESESESESSNSSAYKSSEDDNEESNEDPSDEDDDMAPDGKRVKASSRKRKGSPKQKPISNKIPKIEEKVVVATEVKEIVRKMRNDLLSEIERLGERLPPNTLDQLIDELGGPTEVAEMTGRKGRVIQDEQGSVSYESRSESDVSLETINLKEKERFMKGEKLIAIISEAASSGISLQSDRRVLNQRKRVHITLELPWSADRAIQQFGRSHRSNQVHPPEYMFLISNMAGEQRFASIVAKRLESLGALTHGDRRATESRDLSKYNIDNKFGRLALSTVMRSVMNMERPIVPPPPGYQDENSFYAELATSLVGVGLVVNSPQFPGMTVLDKDAMNMNKFLNRILGMPIKTQNALFQYFTDTLAEVVKRAKRNGRYDLGILDMAGGELKDLQLVTKLVYERRHATGTGMLELYEITVNRGMSWDNAEERFQSLSGKSEGFYLSTRTVAGKRQCLLAVQNTDSTTTSPKKKDSKGKKESYMIYKPHLGLLPQKQSLSNFSARFEKVEPDIAKSHWEEQYHISTSTCSHVYWSNGARCKPGVRCEVGLRRRTLHVLSGSILLAWHDVESVLMASNHSVEMKLQVVRVRGESFKTIGLLIPMRCVESLKSVLSQSERQEMIDG